MYLTNFHSHCVFCDGSAPMEVFVRHALSKGLKAYGISSHAPVPFSNNWSMKDDDVEDYLNVFNRLKNRYKDKIELYIGMEMDYLAREKDFVFNRFSSLPLDYRIGSVHYIDTLDDGKLYWNVGGDPVNYRRGLNELYGGSFKTMMTRYYQMTMSMIETGRIDIVGHIDKITDLAERYYSSQFSPDEKWYSSMFSDVLGLVKEKDLIVEINTKGVLSKGRVFPHQRHLRQIKDMGIRIMVNSDAHKPDLITAGFPFAYNAIKEAGFKSVCVLKKGQWTDIDI